MEMASFASPVPTSLLGQDQDIAFSFWAAGLADAAQDEDKTSSDLLLVGAFSVEEAIFGFTRVEVMLVAHQADIDLEALIDRPATLSIHHKYLPQLRHFSGIVMEAERGDSGHHRTAYRLVLLPALARLDHGSDCRIFQNMCVPDIVGTIFSEHGIEDVEWRLSGEHQTREYCSQYRETHLAFIERILAEEGIFYYFAHDGRGKHRLILSDAPEMLEDCPGAAQLEYHALASTAIKSVYCASLNYRKKLRSTTYIQRDYTFKNPVYHQEHHENSSHKVGEQGDYALYDYPGRYKQSAVGKNFTRHKLEAARVDTALVHGIANAPHLLSGHGVTIMQHPDPSLNQKWRLLTIRHEGVQPQAMVEDAQGTVMERMGLVAPSLNGTGTSLAGLSFGISGSQSPGILNAMLSRKLGLAVQEGADGQHACLYACAFSAQAADLPYRPPQVNKPHVDGPQVAIVVGPEGEQIYTDEYGRVKVHFPWDRHKDPKAEDSSCWIRVSQAWGGGSFGNIAIPRIGQEVIVDYLEGDPDQPIIMGRTYHANNHTPYKLPDHKTKMAIRSDTHKGDGGFNELSFEDEAGSENMFLHAERDQTIKVKNNQTQRVDANALQAIGQNQAIEVGNNVNHQIGGGMNQVIGAVGSAATGLIGLVLQGLMEQSSALLQQGIGLAAQMMQANNGGGGKAKGGKAIKRASAQPLMQFAAKDAVAANGKDDSHKNDAPSPTSDAIAAPADNADALAAEATNFASVLSLGGAVGALAGVAQSFDGSRSGINEAARFDLRSEGGKSMSNAGSELAQNVANMIGGGVLNQLISKFHNATTGIAKTEQVGQVMVTTVGQVHLEQVGHSRKITAGEEFTVAVGPTKDENGHPVPPKALLVMKSDGSIILKGVKIYLDASGPIEQTGEIINLN